MLDTMNQKRGAERENTQKKTLGKINNYLQKRTPNLTSDFTSSYGSQTSGVTTTGTYMQGSNFYMKINVLCAIKINLF